MNKLFLFGLCIGICITLLIETFVHIYVFKKTWEVLSKYEMLIKNDS